ncbi:MAG: nitroreductase family protein [Desulforhopalus sp.]|nr:nitroreductase family protein [Desulforhopalus sp.]
MDLQFSVDQELCIGCGECINDCPYGLIEMRDGIPVLSRENEARCLQCQHCFAVCSTGALSILGKKAADSPPLGPLPTAEQLAGLMKVRRSVRRYSKTPVSKEEIAFLLETVAYAPTAVNNRQVLCTVIEDPAVMDDLRRTTYARLQTLIDTGKFPKGMQYLEDVVVEALQSGKDAIFRGAPHLLVASAPKDSPSPDADCFIALSYFELLAASMGLGALWCGLAKWALAVVLPEVMAKLGLPADHRVGYMMVFGRPAVQYHRTVQRENAHINRVAQLQ